MNFVERGLILHDGFDVQKFSLSYHGSDLSYVMASISFAVRHNVQNLDLNISHFSFKLPHCLFASHSLTELTSNSISYFGSTQWSDNQNSTFNILHWLKELISTRLFLRLF
ncbi:hypothetical protein GIB67_020790, partial [Kingdonia uniflora]